MACPWRVFSFPAFPQSRRDGDARELGIQRGTGVRAPGEELVGLRAQRNGLAPAASSRVVLTPPASFVTTRTRTRSPSASATVLVSSPPGVSPISENPTIAFTSSYVARRRK